MKKLTLFCCLIFVTALAFGDNCGSEDDCEVVPGNTDAATGVAAAGAGVAAFASAAAVMRRREDDTTELDPEEGDKLDEEEGTGTTGTLEDIFGTAEAESPPAEDPIRRGPPDMALGEDPPTPPDNTDTPR